MIGESLAHYEIQRRIGAGGMGMVYAAVDKRLERPVAIKVMHEGLEDAGLRERLWREARAAAATQHPGVCQVYEVGEHEGRLFIVMELLQGQTLEDRLQYGRMEPDEAVRIGLALLDTLAALHRRQLLHRDIKPSNVFLLDDGRTKLMDFGLVRPSPRVGDGDPDATALTRPGIGVGTPGYMSPEQALGEELDERSDLFAVGVVVYEAIHGKRPFRGGNAIEIMNAVLKERPAPLRGSPFVEALSRIVLRAMARNREDRYPDAESMARDLRALRTGSTASQAVPTPTAVTRLAVLPFRMLRPDPERDFLGPSLADAITLSLTGIESLVVRSTLASARFAREEADLERLGGELDVDVVLSGTLLVAGERCRATAQLVETPSGRIRWTEVVDVSSRDIFELQDTLSHRIVESLQLPLTERERGGLSHDVPASPSGYELFLRANELAKPDVDPPVARDLYVRALEVDPHFAPAWARLANCYRLLGKYFPQARDQNYARAEEALARAFELRADFPAAALVRAHIDLDRGRPEEALAYLLDLVERNANDVSGYTGLVTALRYVGMLDESLRAHERVKQLDPNARTSVSYTYVLLDDLERAVAESPEPDMLLAFSWVRKGDRARGIEAMERVNRGSAKSGRRAGIEHMLGALRGEEHALAELITFFREFPDPEGRTHGALFLATIEHDDLALETLHEALEGGYFPLGAASYPALARYEGNPRFEKLLQYARNRVAKAKERFAERVTQALSHPAPA